MSVRTIFGLQAITSFQAPKKEGDKVVFKSYKDGDHIEAIEAEISALPESHATGFYSLDGYFIQKSNVYVLGTMEQPMEDTNEATVIENKDLIEGSTKETIERNTNVKQVVETLKTRNNRAMQGAMLGAGAGLIYSLVKSKNKAMWIGIGAVGGYLIGNMIAKSNSENK